MHIHPRIVAIWRDEAQSVFKDKRDCGVNSLTAAHRNRHLYTSHEKDVNDREECKLVDLESIKERK